MNKRSLITLVVLVAAVGIGYFSLRNQWPIGTEGAIGVAERYSDEQITPADVVLEDADIQAFMQSDLFRKMQTDPDFRNQMMSNRAAFADAQFMRAIDPLLASELSDLRMSAMDASTWSVLDGQTIKALQLDAMSSALDGLQALSDAAMSKIAEDHLPQYFPGNSQVVNTDYAMALSDEAQSLLNDESFWSQLDANSWSALVDAAQSGQLDAMFQKMDLNASKLDAFSQLSDAAMSKIAEDHLPQYFPGNSQVSWGDAMGVKLSDNAQSMLGNGDFWSQLGVDGWSTLAVDAQNGKLDAFAEIIDGFGYQLDAATFSIDAMRQMADENNAKLSMDAQQMLLDANTWNALSDNSQAMIDAMMSRQLDQFASTLDGARAKMDAGTFKIDAYRAMDGAIGTLDAAQWRVLDAMNSSQFSDFSRALSTDQFASVIAADGFASLADAHASSLTDADFWGVMSIDAYGATLSDARWSAFAASDEFTSALSE